MRSPKKQLSRYTLAMVSAGLALATCCFPLLAGASAALGPWVALAVLISAGLCWCASRFFAELAGMYPGAAGLRTWVGRAFGREAGLTLALLYLFLVISIGAAETWLLSKVLTWLIPGLPAIPVVMGFVALCVALNVRGVELTGRVQAWMTSLVIGGVCAASLFALFGAPSGGGGSLPPLEVEPLLSGVALVVFLFVGFEWVVNAMDARHRALPSAMSLAIAGLALTYMLMGVAMWWVLPTDALGSVTAHIEFGGALGGAWGRGALVIVSIVATLTSFNSGILGASRLTYALAREGALPSRLAALHPDFLTPHRAIYAIAGLAALSALTLSQTDAYTVPVMIGAAIECIAFAGVALAFARLRKTEADVARPYRAPLSRGAAVVLAVIFGALAVGSLMASAERWAALTIFIAVALAAAAWSIRIEALRKGAEISTNARGRASS